MKKRVSTAVVLLGFLSIFCSAEAESTVQTLLNVTFQEHAVLQRDKPLVIWGSAHPSAEVSIVFAGHTGAAMADARGIWQLTFPAMPTGGPYTLSAKASSGEVQSVADVMLGDVYLCSGQSNMEMPVRLASNYDSEIAAAANNNIRLFHIPRTSSPQPRIGFERVPVWRVENPQSIKEFSAVCYYFAKHLQPVANVPLGLIEAAWGGSPIQAWIRAEKLQALGGYETPLDILEAYTKAPPQALVKWQGLARTWWRSHDPAFGALPAWSDPNLDDSSWDDAIPVGNWREWNIAPLKTFEGLVWLRKSFMLTAAQAHQTAVLSLGPIDRADTTWINGVDIGEFEGPENPRKYTVPVGVLHKGRNVLAIGVVAGGGLLESAERLSLRLTDGTTVGLGGTWRYRLSAPLQQTGTPPHVPWLNQQGVSVLYNGMIAPLGETALRAVIWYQGESDAWQAGEYARLLPGLIADWRSIWGNDTPFFLVQLPGFGTAKTRPERSDWAALREVQRRVAGTISEIGLAVTIDLGARDTMHPTTKQEVGRRLALLAARQIYQDKVIDAAPIPVKAVRRDAVIEVSFTRDRGDLVAVEWKNVIGFQLCESEDVCHYAEGELDGNIVRLDARSMPSVAFVRFGWSASPLCNLYDTTGLPVGPFEIPITESSIRP